MPKRKPDVLHAVRIEMNEKERELLEQYMVGQTVKNVVVPAAIVAGVSTASYIGYKAAKQAYGWGEDVVDRVQQAMDETGLDGSEIGDTGATLVDALVGKRHVYDEKTGKTYTNPFAGIIFLGPLFGAGINIGRVTNPFD